MLEHPGGELGPRSDSELGQDVCHVTLGRGHCDDQPLRDLPIAKPVRHESGDLSLPWRQRIAILLSCRVACRAHWGW